MTMFRGAHLFPPLRRTGIESLDEALYAASCFSGNAKDGSRAVTILTHIEGDVEHYRIEDGRVGAYRDNATGVDWEPVYTIESRSS